MNLSEAFDILLSRIEAELQRSVHIPHPDLAAYYGMMHYHLGWADEAMQPLQIRGGKRLRPLLCLLFCKAAGGDTEQALPAACALELIHNFSLVHDDIQDGSRRRRGRPAVWTLWGTAHGINVGDGLFVLARLALQRLNDRHLSHDRLQAAMLAFDRACLALCEGQFFDMSFEDRMDVDLEQYLWMIRHKTARLFAASAELGAIVATDNAKLVEDAYRFGEHLGMAFQIQDDILGTWGDERLTGKSTATDIRDRKKTLPVVYVLTHPDERASARQLIDLYRQDGPLSRRAIQAVLAILDRAGARQYAEEMAEEHFQQALASLASMEIEEPAQSQLHELAALLMGRKA
jgi:geranylgeranyl diphosphate synthase type I